MCLAQSFLTPYYISRVTMVILYAKKSPLAIEVHNLVKRYQARVKNAVDGVDLEQARRDLWLLRTQRSGKSTTYWCVGYFLFPTSGKVLVNGFDVTQEPDQVRATTGVVYQQVSLDEKLTVEENLRSHAVLYNLASYAPLYTLMSEQYKQRLAEVLELVGLPGTKDQVVKKLSGGMRRRIDMAKAIMHIPKPVFR